MEKILKRIVEVIAIISLLYITILNICFNTALSNDLQEHISFSYNGILKCLLIMFIALITYLILTKINLKNKKIKYVLMGIIIILYLLTQLYFINYRNAYPAWDQQSVYELATSLYEGKKDALKKNGYLSRYPLQTSLVYVEAFAMKLFKTSNPKLLQYINAVCNCFTIIAVLMIIKELSKKAEVNETVGFVTLCLFSALPMLSTFIYGDIPGITFALFGILFILKYGNTTKNRYLLISSFFTCIAYLVRTNTLIIIIADFLYLILILIRKISENKKMEESKNKEKTINIVLENAIMLIIFAFIVFFPATMIKNISLKKYEIDENLAIPSSTWIYLGMTDGYRCAGWYNGNASYAWKTDTKTADQYYKKNIVERLKEFKNNPKEFVKFYTRKNTSMWGENTYASFYYNGSFNIGKDEFKNEDKDKRIFERQELIEKVEKIVTTVIFAGSLMIIIIRFKKMTAEEVLFAIIFLGGFFFHNLWEAKSRYVIPYIICLIPLVSIKINVKGFLDKKNIEIKEREN